VDGLGALGALFATAPTAMCDRTCASILAALRAALLFVLGVIAGGGTTLLGRG